MITQITSEVTGAESELRLEKLRQVRRTGLFIGSVWAYGDEVEQPLIQSSTLWTPMGYNVDSGRLAVYIKEWGALPRDDTEQPAQGTGELERGRELLMDIFETMSSRGLVRLVAVPESPITI